MDSRNFLKITNNRAIGLTAIVVWMLLISACQTEPINYRPPDLDEIQEFSKEQGITPIEDKLLKDSVVLLYEKGNSFGYYVLSVQEPEGEMIASSNVSAPKSDHPILIIGHMTGDQPFIAVLIQDTTLLAETTAIEVVIDSQNRLTATIHNQQGAILVSPSPFNGWRTVSLYNSQGDILYSQEDQ